MPAKPTTEEASCFTIHGIKSAHHSWYGFVQLDGEEKDLKAPTLQQLLWLALAELPLKTTPPTGAI